jgi:hypothetical protein
VPFANGLAYARPARAHAPPHHEEPQNFILRSIAKAMRLEG